MVHCYLFEASSIQQFVFASNRLKEIVGASELVEALCGDLLDSALQATHAEGRVTFSRKAGGAFFAFFDDLGTRDEFATLWPLVVQQHAPGLTFVAARGSGASEAAAFASAKRPFFASRNVPPVQLPMAGPFALRNQRTGMPAVAIRGYDREAVDASTSRKLDLSSGRSLAGRCSSKSELNWPIQLSAELESDDEDVMPYRGEKQWLALIHADGNGLGQLLIRLDKEWQDASDFRARFSAVSTAVSRATEKAVQEAVTRVLEPAASGHLLPARPIILGGDDLTMLVRADLALDFTQAFLEEFEERTGVEFDVLRTKAGYDALPERLTACAGIAYMDARRPFYLAYGLANNLCKIAKKSAKKHAAVPSAVSFHRVTTSFIPDAEDVFADEMVSHIDGGEFRHTMAVYAAREAIPTIPATAQLMGFRDFISREDVGRGRFRRLLDEMSKGNGAEAEKLYRRWKEISEKDLVTEFEARLTTLTGSQPLPHLPYAEVNGSYRTPLGDALALAAVDQED
jgi:hypothetical protein